MPKPLPKPSATKELQAWIMREIARGRPFSLPLLAKRGSRRFATDPEFVQRFAGELLELTIYNLARRLIGDGRTTLDLRPHMPLPGNPARDIWARWSTHYEHVGDQYIPLPELTPETGLVAVAERERALAADERPLEFLRRVIARLAPRQPVRACWNPQELTALQKSIKDAA